MQPQRPVSFGTSPIECAAMKHVPPYLAELFKETVTAFLNRKDPTLKQQPGSRFDSGQYSSKSMTGRSSDINEEMSRNFAQLVKDAVSLQNDTLYFSHSDGQSAFTDRSRIFQIEGALYVLRNGMTGAKPQVELVPAGFLDTKNAAYITAYSGITLDSLTKAIFPYPTEVQSLINVFKNEGHDEDQIKQALQGITLNESKVKSGHVSIRAEDGVFQTYRLVEKGKDISISLMKFINSFDAEYIDVGVVAALSLAEIKENFPAVDSIL